MDIHRGTGPILSEQWDAIVVGGGHNGLICAAYLGRAGRRVLLLEQRPQVGGAALTESVFPGFSFSVASDTVSLLRPWIWRDLSLSRHGLRVEPLVGQYGPQVAGPGLALWHNSHRTYDELARFSVRDAQRFPDYRRVLNRLSQLGQGLLDHAAPRPTSLSPRDLSHMWRVGSSMVELGPEIAAIALQFPSLSALDFLDGWFESDTLKALLAYQSIPGSRLSVRAPGSAYGLLHANLGQHDGAVGRRGMAIGGNGAVTQAILRAALGFGVEVRCDATVDHVRLRGERAVGVTLENGDELSAKTVVSGCDPKRTLLSLVGEEHLSDVQRAQVHSLRTAGSTAKVNLAVDALPTFVGRSAYASHLRSEIAVAPSVTYLDDAWSTAEQGQMPDRPPLRLVVPSQFDGRMAPVGKHVLSVLVSYVPTHSPDPDHVGKTVLRTLEDFSPGLTSSVRHMQVLTPRVLQATFGLTDGHIYHVAHTPDQLGALRTPTNSDRYRTPFRGLWMCSAGVHPGGGVMGASGGLCAQAILHGGSV